MLQMSYFNHAIGTVAKDDSNTARQLVTKENTHRHDEHEQRNECYIQTFEAAHKEHRADRLKSETQKDFSVL